MSPVREDRPSTGFTVFAGIFGAGVGYLVGGFTAAFAELFMGVQGRGIFMLLWLLTGFAAFAWVMGIATRMRAGRRIRAEAWRRVGDLDYEPPGGVPRFRTGRSKLTAEQRMAEYLKNDGLRAHSDNDADPSE